jgi:hypothetical protein
MQVTLSGLVTRKSFSITSNHTCCDPSSKYQYKSRIIIIDVRIDIVTLIQHRLYLSRDELPQSAPEANQRRDGVQW